MGQELDQVKIHQIGDILCAFVPEDDIDAAFDLLSVYEWTEAEKKLTNINPFIYYISEEIKGSSSKPLPLKSVINNLRLNSMTHKIQAHAIAHDKYYAKRKAIITLTEKDVAPEGSLIYNLSDEADLLRLIKTHEKENAMIGDVRIQGSVILKTKIELKSTKGLRENIFRVYRKDEKIADFSTFKLARHAVKELLKNSSVYNDQLEIRKETIVGGKPFLNACKNVTKVRAKARYDVYEEKREPKIKGWVIAGRMMTINGVERE